MVRGNRKSTPGVVRGRVQAKNDRSFSSDYYYEALRPGEVAIDRKRPGEGYRHLLTRGDLHRFLELLPDWDELAVGLNAVVLAPGDLDTDGYHVPGVVHVCAWENSLWRETTEAYYRAHQALLERLGVPCEPFEDGWRLRFDETTARAYQLLHVLLHELGHHHDRMTTRRQKRAGRGEAYAEAYAFRNEALIWERYGRTFGL